MLKRNYHRKQFKLIYGVPLTDTERKLWRPAILANYMMATRSLMEAMDKLGIAYENLEERKVK
jgi:hypothetical protein